MSFYPAGYEKKEKPNDYMKLTEGEHKIRILTSPIIGYETWTGDGPESKPHRAKTFKEGVGLPNRDGNVKEFHAFIVWDYETNMVRLLNVTQPSVQDGIYKQSQDEDWADPTQYDIVITRTGKGKFDTRYTLTFKLPKPMSEEIKKAFNAVKIVPENYFTDGNPIVRESDEKQETMSDAEVQDINDQIPF